ncbi:MAG: UbiA family prenyltransferase [Candidatus Omnitrophica bacterium]|nr:UbiA family prenyltransferase [Candidatus Omnitrophota bacterium]
MRDIAEALKLEHTVFALPFAYLGLWVAARGSPAFSSFGWVTLAMVAARTAGMAVNRRVDLPLDRLNPRTKDWPVPAGRVRGPLLAAVAAAATGLFLLAASRLNPLCLRLAPWALLLLAAYPYTKRFTWTCHFWLGAVLGSAPVGGWLAVTGRWDPKVLPLFIGVLFWVAGFDILYALLDLDFDRRQGVYSIPQTFGLKSALKVSRLCHLLAACGFAWFGASAVRGGWFWVGWALVAGLLVVEHRLVSPTRLDRINRTFFTINGWVSVSFFLFTLLGLKSS